MCDKADWCCLPLIAVSVAAAPLLAPNAPEQRFDDLLYAPPTRIHIWNEGSAARLSTRSVWSSRLERTIRRGPPTSGAARVVHERSAGHPAGMRRCCCSAPTAMAAMCSPAFLYGGRISLTLALARRLCAVRRRRAPWRNRRLRRRMARCPHLAIDPSSCSSCPPCTSCWCCAR